MKRPTVQKSVARRTFQHHSSVWRTFAADKKLERWERNRRRMRPQFPLQTVLILMSEPAHIPCLLPRGGAA